ncbi:MAG: hypothetical protein AAGC46_00370 [Solirubrobacteraceae bacterium]|nr:hypothetical protein [Patulibacter sp.]
MSSSDVPPQPSDPRSPSPDHAPHGVVPGIDWIVVAHPDREVAGARAASVGASLAGVPTSAASTGTDARRAASAREGCGLFLVHVAGIDRFVRGWSGERLATRVRSEAGHTCVAWVPHGDLDGAAAARAVGLTVVDLDAVRDAPAEVARILRVATSVVPSPPDPGGAPGSGEVHGQPHSLADTLEGEDFVRWFRARYDRRWEPAMEHLAVALLGGGCQADQADRLCAEHVFENPRTATRRLRSMAECLSGEIRGDDALVRDEAAVVVRRLGRACSLTARPFVARSLALTVRRLAADPTLAAEAGLVAADVDVLTRVSDGAERVVLPARRGCGAPRPGRPPAGIWKLRRDLAIGRIAGAPGGDRVGKLGRQRALDALVARALEAVDDVLLDRERRHRAAG